ncbi:MAG: tRNA epoxyqueuosine(34) reductase QueG [Spirosomataceae bacterium]
MAYIVQANIQENIRKKAYQLGFQYIGFSKAAFLEKEAPRLEHWLNQNYHGKMAYMANHFDLRLDPRKLVDGAKTVISLLFNYFPDEKLEEKENDLKISKYAYGTDYHFVLKDRMKQLLDFMQEQIGEINGRVFVDSAPVMDKAWAEKSGLGWIGKNANLITKQTGSFFFIGEIICDVPFQEDGPIRDYCGTCTRCIDACPTDAIVEPYVIDGSKCISYYTIELKEAIPEEMAGKFKNWVFGCDICQDVCPWNRFSKPHTIPEFALSGAKKEHQKKQWTEITQDIFPKVFKNSPIKRTKWEGFVRNLAFVNK